MFKKSLFFLLFSIGSSAFAQNVDSINLVNANWFKQPVAKRTHLIVHHFNEKNLFLANQNLSYVEVKNRGSWPKFAIGYEVKQLKTTSTFGKENNAFVAINGTFFDTKNGGSVDFIKADGKTIHENKIEKSGNRARHQKAVVAIENGKLTIKKWDGTEDWETRLTEPEAMNTGPLLIYNNEIQELDTTAFSRLRNPRSAIGIKPNGKIILLTVDGRNENAAGMSLPELRNVMKWLGCTTALNLDGGGSTALWVDQATENGIVNYPSDNKKWDHTGERKVANVILLKKKQ